MAYKPPLSLLTSLHCMPTYLSAYSVYFEGIDGMKVAEDATKVSNKMMLTAGTFNFLPDSFQLPTDL
jgi:hypothetical protein